jgi:hypothetical protein
MLVRARVRVCACMRSLARVRLYACMFHILGFGYGMCSELDIHVSVHHDIIYENDLQDATV